MSSSAERNKKKWEHVTYNVGEYAWVLDGSPFFCVSMMNERLFMVR